MFLGISFGKEAGYWPWAIIMAVISAALAYGLRVVYKIGGKSGS